MGVFPPNTLFSLKRIEAAGVWEAPNGTHPQQRLLVVTATYNSPSLGEDGAIRTGKMCPDAAVLCYGDREGFVKGLDDLISRPALLHLLFSLYYTCHAYYTHCTTLTTLTRLTADYTGRPCRWRMSSILIILVILAILPYLLQAGPVDGG